MGFKFTGSAIKLKPVNLHVFRILKKICYFCRASSFEPDPKKKKKKKKKKKSKDGAVLKKKKKTLTETVASKMLTP